MSYINLPKNGEMIYILQQKKYFYKFCPSFVFMVQWFFITNLEKKKLSFNTKHVHLFVLIFLPPNVFFHNNALRDGLQMSLLKTFT
jgi:hypothetical protein